jgi:hypothetical protein
MGSGWTAASLALHMQAVSQGTFILAYTTGDTVPVQASIDHVRRAGFAAFLAGQRMRNPNALHPTTIDYKEARYEGTAS